MHDIVVSGVVKTGFRILEYYPVVDGVGFTMKPELFINIPIDSVVSGSHFGVHVLWCSLFSTHCGAYFPEFGSTGSYEFGVSF